MKTFLGIDPGSTWGWAAYGEGISMDASAYGSKKFTGLYNFEAEIAKLIHDWQPVGILTCRAMGPHAQVTRYHAAMAGVVELTCQRMEVPYFDVADGTMRKVVVGKGNAKKPEVMDYLKIDNEHAADAMVGARYLAEVSI